MHGQQNIKFIPLTFNGRAFQEVGCLSFESGTDRFSWNVGNW
jgi:hypothetical protein